MHSSLSAGQDFAEAASQEIFTDIHNPARPGGIHIQASTAGDIETARQCFHAQLARLNMLAQVETSSGVNDDGHFIEFRLASPGLIDGVAACDTTGLCQRFGLDTVANPDDLTREILLAMLMAPAAFQRRFPSYEELASAVRIRQHIVDAARKTTLSFDTMATERPEDCWQHVRGRGFTLRAGSSLIGALKKATQPGESGALYAFSCYRATEYVILLGIAQELASYNPPMFDQLQTLWQSRAIMSGEFHEVFLVESGSVTDPLPLKYYVPGDRVWFRNPDAHSSDVTGYEGSWVIYLGGGLFTNFWRRGEPYLLTTKCVEVFHWRDATYRDAEGDLQVDEARVAQLVHGTMQDPAAVERILAQMMRLREPSGVYQDGGCIDASREYPRGVCPGTGDLRLPHA
jgi:hypothetical protein